MNQVDPTLSLEQATQLATRTRTSARWLARYYVIFGVASLALALGVGLVRDTTWLIVLLACWFVLIVGISIYSNRQQTMVRGGGKIHAAVMVAWTLFWVLTVTVGAGLTLPWPWWLAGGLGMLGSALLGAYVVRRRTQPRA